MIQLQVNDEIKRLSQLKKRIEEAIDGGFTEIPKWIEESEEFQTLLRDVEVSNKTLFFIIFQLGDCRGRILVVKEQVSKTEITIIGEQKLAQFSLLLPIRHYRNRKRTGAEMRLAIFSGIVTGGVPFSYWLIFSLVSCNYPRK